jgi:hypothetical protein
MLALSLPDLPVFAAFRSISSFRTETPTGAHDLSERKVIE